MGAVTFGRVPVTGRGLRAAFCGVDATFTRRCGVLTAIGLPGQRSQPCDHVFKAIVGIKAAVVKERNRRHACKRLSADVLAALEKSNGTGSNYKWKRWSSQPGSILSQPGRLACLFHGDRPVVFFRLPALARFSGTKLSENRLHRSSSHGLICPRAFSWRALWRIRTGSVT